MPADRVMRTPYDPAGRFRCRGKMNIAELGPRHAARLGARTLDSLHVACALELRAERFWTFDERQKRLARAEGLTAT